MKDLSKMSKPLSDEHAENDWVNALPEFAAAVVNAWSVDLERAYLNHESYPVVREQLQSLATYIGKIDPAEGDASKRYYELQEQLFRTLCTACPEIKNIVLDTRLAKKRYTSAEPELEVGIYAGASFLNGMLLSRGGGARFQLPSGLTPLERMGARRGKEFDSGEISVILSPEKRGEKELPHEEPPPPSVNAENLFSVFRDPEKELTEKEEAFRGCPVEC